MTDDSGIKLVHATLTRMGTQSLAEAYSILGLKPHHYHTAPIKDSDWHVFERAVDGRWPEAPGAKPGRKRFTRDDWDVVRGDYDFFTDLYSHHSPDLIRAYPEAKVVIVQREFNSWFNSYKIFCLDIFDHLTWIPLRWTLWLFRIPSMDAVEKEKMGFFGVKSTRDITPELARKRYDAFYEEIRGLVSPERSLEYTVGDGWEPLCKFLDKPVPDVPFPHVNTMDAYLESRAATLRKFYFVLTTVAVGFGAAVWYVMK